MFYTLLPQDLVDKIKTLDEEIEGVELRLEEVRVRLGDKKLGAGQKEAYEKRKAAMEKEVENKKDLQKRSIKRHQGPLNRPEKGS